MSDSNILRNGVLLALVALVGVGLLTTVHLLTRERIAEEERLMVMRRLEQVLPMDFYDNDLLTDRIEINDPDFFRHPTPVVVYRARLEGEPAAIIMQVTAPDGYNGDIQMLVSILADGSLAGVRVISHRETPGLGDPIEVGRSDWILEFNGKSLENPSASEWAVRKDGGEFDQFTGATITPRATVGAIKRALEYHAGHADDLYAATHAGENEQ